MSVARGSPQPGWDTYYHVTRWQAGEERSFEVLFRHFSPLLRRRVQRSKHWASLCRRMELDDVVQMIWAEVWKYAGTQFRSRGPGSFYGLVGSIADRVLINLQREGRAQKRGEGKDCASLSQEDGTHATPRPGLPVDPSPTSVACSHEAEGRLHTLLTRDQYTVFYDIEVRGLTAEDLSLVLQKSPSAVRGILRRARLQLMRHFKGERD